MSKTSNWLSFAALPAVLLLVLIAVPACFAHPMGNFSINHYAGVEVKSGSIELRYIIDFAEIPTYQNIQDAGIVTREGDPSLRPFVAKLASEWSEHLLLQVNGQSLRLSPVTTTIIFPPGAGGLPTMKVGIVYRAVLHGEQASGRLRVHYLDENFAGHAGWKEIVVSAGPGVSIDTGGLFRVDRSSELTDYPTSLLNSPPQDLEAQFEAVLAPVASASVIHSASPAALPARAASVQPAIPVTSLGLPAAAAPPLLLAANKQATPRNRFTELMTSSRMGFWFLFTAAFLAAGLGAAHALEPGHGKTIVAAYLVGSRGRMRHAVGLGLLVTAAHTAGVYMLGAVVLYASKYVIPERIYPWLGIFSGLVIAVLAGYLLLRAWTGIQNPTEEAGVLHAHWYNRAASRPPAGKDQAISLRQLLILGITGGIIPCPAALVVLLSAVALHRIAFGLFLIVCFSLGLAAVLIAIGIAMVKAGALLSKWRSDSPWIQRWLPIASASAMLLAGLGIAIAALPATGLNFHITAQNHLGSFVAIVLLGLFLGMRHSTDPDHVVAVSTIVSRERSVRQGAIIGVMWGLGHTLTIFIVGALIILFNLTIPPRVGLSMEMAVAAMLIVLGILNLTGVLQRLTERMTPAAWTRSDPRLGGTPGLLARFGYFQLIRPLVIGLVHGLAGSAAVALLVLSMIHSPAWAIAYLVVFGLGTVIGMMLMTTVMAVPIALTGRKTSRFFTVASGVISVCFGLFLVYQLGFVDGLFTTHAHWTPE